LPYLLPPAFSVLLCCIAEVDAGARTMCFFVGEKKVPRAIANIPVPLQLGVCFCVHAILSLFILFL
jgi:hypothetical protein